MSGRDDSWDVRIAKLIMWSGLIVIGIFAAGLMAKGIILLIKYHPYVALTLGIIAWIIATVWYGLNKIRVMGGVR